METNKVTRQIGLAERAKRLVIIQQAIYDAKDGVEVVVGQLSLLSDYGHNSDTMELEDVGKRVTGELDWLELLATQQMDYLVKLVAKSDEREVHEIVSDDVSARGGIDKTV